MLPVFEVLSRGQSDDVSAASHSEETPSVTAPGGTRWDPGTSSFSTLSY